MEHFFTTTLGIVTSLGAILIVAVTGFLYIVGIYSKQKGERKREEDAGDDRLIKLLQTTVTELEKKVTKQDADLQLLSAEVGKLRSENETLIQILQGRDKQTQLFYEKGFESMKVLTEIAPIIKTIDTTLKDKNESINKLIETISSNAKVVLEAAKLPIK